jgi:RNA polymerase sigma factor (sigma-70 family)
MSHSWLYDHRDQLDGYRAFAEIAYRLRPKVLPQDRDDIEMDIILKLKEVSDRHSGTGDLTALLWHCARAKIADYWKRKEREKRRYARIYTGDKGEMVSENWGYIYAVHDTDAELDTKGMLKSFPARLIEVGDKLVNGERLNVADKSYLSRQRAKLLEDYNYHVGDAEAEQIRHLWQQGLSRRKIAKMLGRSSTTITKYINKLGLG